MVRAFQVACERDKYRTCVSKTKNLDIPLDNDTQLYTSSSVDRGPQTIVLAITNTTRELYNTTRLSLGFNIHTSPAMKHVNLTTASSR